MKEKIVLRCPSVEAVTRNRSLRVSLTPEADIALQKLQIRTGLSARRIVSEILIQVEPFIELQEI